MEFPEGLGGRVLEKNPFRGGGKDILLNYTIQKSRLMHDFVNENLESFVKCQYGGYQITTTCHIKLEIICQLSVRMLRSKYDLPVKIRSHLSVVSTDVEIKA